MNKNTIVLVAVVFAAAAAFGFFYNGDPDEQIARECEKANQSLPKMLDQVTRLDRVEHSPGKHIKYVHTILGMTDSEVMLAKPKLMPLLRAQAEANPIVQKMRAKGALISYQFRNKNGNPLIEFEL